MVRTEPIIQMILGRFRGGMSGVLNFARARSIFFKMSSNLAVQTLFAIRCDLPRFVCHFDDSADLDSWSCSNIVEGHRSGCYTLDDVAC